MNAILNDKDRVKRMKELGVYNKIMREHGEGDEVYGEQDPFSNLHSNGDTEVEYRDEIDNGTLL
jgi:hypothetical protein